VEEIGGSPLEIRSKAAQMFLIPSVASMANDPPAATDL
jgi:hypothetical protein